MRKNHYLKFTMGFVLVVFCFAPCIVHAQAFRATLTGQVTDPSGAVIKGATVIALNKESGTKYKGRTSAKGVFYIPYVLPGAYMVTAQAKGFKTSVQDNVHLRAAQTFNQNFRLAIGAVSQKVVVSAAPPQLETATGSGGTIISKRELQHVPVQGGQIYTLIGTTPGSQFTTTNFGTNGNHGTTGWDTTSAYTLGGGVVGTNQFTLNGTNITSQYSYDNHSAGEWTVSPNMDSVQEVNVMTNTYNARYGRTSGGIVNVVTKSGTNHFHGSVRYAYQGSIFNANTFENNLTGSPRQGEVQNHFWITVGGPVIKNKLFFYFGFEGYRQALAGNTLEHVPPAYLRPGYQGDNGVDFGLVKQMDPSEFPNGLPIFEPGTAYCLTGGAVTQCNSNYVAQTEFPNDTIPGSEIDQTSKDILKYIPLPNIPGTKNLARGNNYIAHTPDLYSYNQPQIRVDYNLTDSTKMYSYFLWWKGSENRSQNGLTGIAANGNINHIREDWVATQDFTHVFSPTLVGDFKVSYDRFFESSPDGDLTQQVNPSTIGLSMPLPGTTTSRYLPEFGVSDVWGTGLLSGNTVFGNNLNADVTNNYELDVDFTKSAGAHNLEFGGQIAEYQYGGVPYGGGHPNGDFSFKSNWTQLNPHNSSCYPITPDGSTGNNCSSNAPNGSSLADMYLGYPSSGGVDWFYSIMDGYPVFSGYFQDNWRVNHRLTLNLGIRYDVQRGLRERHNHLNRGYCFTCVNPLTNEVAYQTNVANAANITAWQAAGINPSSLKTVYGGIQFAGHNGQSRDAYNTDWSDVGPRIGFAYAINPKTVIRGGYGIMYSYGLEGGSSIGEAQTTNYTASTDGGNTPTSYFKSGDPFATGLLKPTGNSLGLLTDVGNGTISLDFPDRKIPREQLVSLGVQRALPSHMMISVKYAGNFTSRLRTFLWRNGVATLAMQKAAEANPQIWNRQVPNPFYGVPGISGPGQCGTGTTVEAIALMLPGSQYCTPGGVGLVGQYNAPLGHNLYNALEVKFNRRVYGEHGHGLSFHISYTYSKTINGDGYENGWPYQDPHQVHWLASTDRTHILSATSVWNLPVGRGGLLFSRPNPIAGRFLNDWTLSGVFNAQSGTPVSLNTGWYYTCPSQSLSPAQGTSVGQGRWLNTTSSCWKPVPTYGLMTLPGTTGQVRNPTIPSLNLSLMKTFPLWNELKFHLRLDAYNAFNSVLFGGPNTNPGAGPATYSQTSGWSGFGTVGPTQQNFPRRLEVTGKISF